ncbi:PREDICTED: uncharacterized protein LOC109475302 [Branchiostoma belcheri]|uniref:Uncharacterized protein LOC109475302 n=1 Tax=Branchiostoma belcheri TaxID=7741 RepID=A0A6P4ZP84_BRABE|nr:PREDICTED: uncharacterized protein LOC109475302 [Branchiostoma belcheri]
MSQENRGITPPKKGKLKKKGAGGNTGHVKTSNTDGTEEWICKKCNTVLRDDEGCQALTCDGCNNHLCLSCTSLTQQEFKALSRLQRDDVCWFCTSCKERVKQCFKGSNSCTASVPNIVEKLDEIVGKISLLENKVDSMQQEQKTQAKLAVKVTEEVVDEDVQSKGETVQTVTHENDTNKVVGEDGNQGPWITVTKHKARTPDLAKILKEALVEQRKAVDEQERRNHNLIIHNVDETDRKDMRKKQDEEFVKDLFENHLEVDVKVKEMYRLGKKTDNDSKRGRPLKITLENKEDRAVILNRLYKLKGAEDQIRRISVTADFSRDEREKIKALVQEAKNRTQQEVKGDYIHVVRGTYPKLQIIRKKQRKNSNLVSEEEI